MSVIKFVLYSKYVPVDIMSKWVVTWKEDYSPEPDIQRKEALAHSCKPDLKNK